MGEPATPGEAPEPRYEHFRIYYPSGTVLLLVATKGEPGVPDEANRPASIFWAPRGKHSAKPKEAYEIIERMYPHGPRIELFARAQRVGWGNWGNEPAEPCPMAQVKSEASQVSPWTA